MGLNLSDSVKEIFRQVTDLTDKGFEFIEKRDLPTHGTVKVARESMPKHLVFYKNASDDVLNHIFAHESGHILRMFSVDKSNRVIPFTNDSYKKIALEQMESDITSLSRRMQFEHLVRILDIWYTGLVRQVTNMAPDIMIEKWIYEGFPELRPMQLASIKRQHSEAVVGLSKRMKDITPLKIYDSANIMNFVFFAMLSEVINSNFKGAFLSTPYPGRSAALLEITKTEYENSYIGDVEMINRWASFLGIDGWFGWRDFEDVPESYLRSH